jgi:hypothetical protein
MIGRKTRLFGGISVAVLILSTVFLSLPNDGVAIFAAAADTSDSDVFLPLLLRNRPKAMSIFGSEVHTWPSQGVAELAGQADLYWLRTNGFEWDRLEPVDTEPPAYDWSKVDASKLTTTAAEGMQIIAIVRYAPDWARKLPAYACGPIAESAFPDYAEFLKALVERYSQPPYNIKYWELGNEPDAPPNPNLGSRPAFGCWGDVHDEYYGGGYYAEMLKWAYPAIKAADPQAQVLIGGLLLDCEPGQPSCQSDIGKFLEGILKNGGGDYFDLVSFHGYPVYLGPEFGVGGLYQDEHHPKWEQRGGIVMGKIDFIREVMAKYAVDKPIIDTEGSLICPDTVASCNPPANDFYETQADYVVWLFVRNWAAGLKGTIWYQFEGPGWRYGALLDENQNPKPAYHALKFLTQELKGATFSTTLTQYSALRAFEFTAPGKKIWVMWAPDETPHSISLPAGVLKVYNKYGVDITPTNNNIAVDNPIYVELTP